MASLTSKQINRPASNLACELLALHSKTQMHNSCLSLCATEFLLFFDNNKGQSNEFVTWLI